MFGLGKSKETKQKQSWINRLSSGLKRTRSQFTDSLAELILGKKTIDDELLTELETLLLQADCGAEATQRILSDLTDQVSRKALSDPNQLIEALKQQLLAILSPCEEALTIDTAPFVLLMVGINGAGKTTSAAKLAHYYKKQGKRVLLAAGDTFRAAAIEQLQTWGERNNVPVIAQQSGADSASVIYDAMQATQARHGDLLIADTAGRLHTQDHLMAELAKIKRVMTKLDEHAPQEVMLVIDAGLGQNAIHQAEQFHDSIGLTGISITKLDGTAKGGVLISIAQKMKLPIRFIGVGEDIDDLKPFNASNFVDALFSTSS